MTLPSDRMGQCIKARVWWEMLIVAKTLRRIAGRIDPAGYINYAQEGEDQLLLRLFEGRECGFYVGFGAPPWWPKPEIRFFTVTSDPPEVAVC